MSPRSVMSLIRVPSAVSAPVAGSAAVNPFSSSHVSICSSVVDAVPRNPSVTVLSGQSSRIFDKLPLIPLEPLVQKGMIVFPEKS